MKGLGIVLLLCTGVLCTDVSATELFGKRKKKKQQAVEASDTTRVKAESAYEKFVKDAEVKRGMFNVIKKKDKVYLEIL